MLNSLKNWGARHQLAAATMTASLITGIVYCSILQPLVPVFVILVLIQEFLCFGLGLIIVSDFEMNERFFSAMITVLFVAAITITLLHLPSLYLPLALGEEVLTYLTILMAVWYYQTSPRLNGSR